MRANVEDTMPTTTTYTVRLPLADGAWPVSEPERARRYRAAVAAGRIPPETDDEDATGLTPEDDEEWDWAQLDATE